MSVQKCADFPDGRTAHTPASELLTGASPGGVFLKHSARGIANSRVEKAMDLPPVSPAKESSGSSGQGCAGREG